MINLKILFKNTTKYSQQIYKKFLEFHKNKFNFSYTLYTAIVLIAIFFCLAMQVKYHNYNIAILLAISLSCFFLWRFLHPMSEVRKDFNSDKIQNEKEFTFNFYEKYFKIRDKNKYEIVKYRNLYKVFETTEFFYLYIDKTHAYLVSKSGFTKGTSLEFVNFIKKKCRFRFKLVKE